MADLSDSVITAYNADFIAELYRKYLDDPSVVDKSWASLFSNLEDDKITIHE